MTLVADKVDPVGSLALIPVTDLRHWNLTVATRREERGWVISTGFVVLLPAGDSAKFC